MSDPSDDNGESKRASSRSRPASRMDAARSDLEKMKSARAKAGVHTAEIRIRDDIYESHTLEEYERKRAKDGDMDDFVEDDIGDYASDGDVFDDEQKPISKKSGKKSAATKSKSSAASIEAAARRKKKQEAENPSNSRLESKAPVNTIMQSFAKATGGSKKRQSSTHLDESLDDLIGSANLLDDDEDEKPVKSKRGGSAAKAKSPPKPSKSKSPPKPKKTASLVKIELTDEANNENSMEVDAPVVSKATETIITEVSDMTDEDWVAAEMAAHAEKAKKTVAKKSVYQVPMDQSVMDESVMVEVDEDTHQYKGSDWFSIQSAVEQASKNDLNKDASLAASKQRAVLADFKPLLDANGSLLMYWLDAYEDVYTRPGTVFVFGYVWNQAKGTHHSICVSVENIQRILHFFPKEGCTPEEVLAEFTEIRKQKGIKQAMSKIVEKKYTFDVDEVPRGKHKFLEVLYPYSDEPLNAKMEGRTFSHIFGTTRTALETLLLEAKLMGPGWIVIKQPKVNVAPSTWCSFECRIDDVDNLVCARFPSSTAATDTDAMNTSVTIIPNTTFQYPPTPKLKLLSLKIKVIHDIETKKNEIWAVTGIEKFEFDVEKATDVGDLHRSAFRVWTILRRVNGIEQPAGLNHFLKSTPHWSYENSEKALLNCLMTKIGAYDPDIIIGHGIANFDLDVLLHRLAEHKIPMWSKLGRLHKSAMPRLKALGEGSAGFAERQATAGRLICDTYTAATEFLRSQKNYKLKTLAKVHLDAKAPPEIPQREVVEMMSDTKSLKLLVDHSVNEAYLALQLVAKLDALPLTKQLTELGGNLWSRSLTGARAERIEYLLMHRFYNLPAPGDADQIGYIIPDKAKTDGDGKRKKNAAYKGGHVFDPQSGLYEQMTLLLDFNSLYPSLIQEYNVCFTTIERSKKPSGEWDISEPPSANVARGILPATIRELVDKRKVVKNMMKTEKDATKLKQLEMRQLAIKLVANSMYGCLGFKSSRFCAIPMAELITRKGREALMQAREIATAMNMMVIYGDTDSIMINTGTTDYQAVREMGLDLKKRINKKFKELEIDIDGIFKSLLLLQKKKYAAMLVTSVRPDGTLELTRQEKGLDLVRRDWCPLASNTGRTILECIFDEKHEREKDGTSAAEGIQEILRKQSQAVRDHLVPIEDFAITKSMTKRPEDYPDAANQPHVQVALALRREGQSIMVGEMIQYVICVIPQKPGQTGNQSIADRARHPDHVKRDKLKIDYNWYLTHQVHPSAARLCEHIEGLNSTVIAECLGLDANAFKSHSGLTQRDLAHLPSATQQTAKTRFANCERLKLKCPKCGQTFEYQGLLDASIPLNAALDTVSSQDYVTAFYQSMVHECGAPIDDNYLKNSVTLFLRHCQTMNYGTDYTCDDCGKRTRVPTMFRDGKARCRYCFELLHDETSPQKLYTQLQYLRHVFDVDYALDELFKHAEDKKYRDAIKASSHCSLNVEIKAMVEAALQQNKYAVIPCESIFSCFLATKNTVATTIGQDIEFSNDDD